MSVKQAKQAKQAKPQNFNNCNCINVASTVGVIEQRFQENVVEVQALCTIRFQKNGKTSKAPGGYHLVWLKVDVIDPFDAYQQNTSAAPQQDDETGDDESPKDG